MPLFYTHNINDTARLAVWQIREDDDFFKKITIPRSEISHPHKRLQHLAGRYLLKILDDKFPVQEILLDGRRPYLLHNTFYFSISHCADYAAAIISKEEAVGVDVELATHKVVILKEKYLNEAEQQLICNNYCNIDLLYKLTACWSAKEAMFKWYAKGSVNFRRDMTIKSFSGNENNGEIRAVFGKEVNKECIIQFRFFNDLCLAWLI